MSEFLILDNVSYSYPGSEKSGVCQVNLALKQGEFLGVLGANGSGKSTLARLCCGLIAPTKGRVVVDGHTTEVEENLPYIHQQIGLVFQHPDNQFVASTVETEVAFGLENQALSSMEIRSGVDEALACFYLSGLCKVQPHLLSGGEKRLLSLAGIWNLKPKLLIVDEPLSMLDPGARKSIHMLLQELREAGQTIMWITHNMEEVMMADRVMVMAGGKMVWIGPPGELLKIPEQAKDWGVTLPLVFQLGMELGLTGFYPTTEDELVSEIWKLI
jgi:energy-coupling factor transport system ATP-binding protein